MDIDKKHWQEVADKELREALSYSWNTNTAKNVVLFVGDGMSPDTITASRIYRNGEDSYLAWERFPHVGLLKVYLQFSILIAHAKRLTSTLKYIERI